MANSIEDSSPRVSLAGSDEPMILPNLERPGPFGGSNKRALKIAGLTTLACLLLASQVFTAYMVFDQKDQIQTLKKSSERLGRQLTRASHAAAPMKMQLPMNTLPLMMDDDNSKTPLTKLQDTAIVSVEKQLKDLLQDTPLPQFNETFLANLQGLKQGMNESEWKSFESWMRYWLIFQMAQQKPKPPTAIHASTIKTKCQMESGGKIGSYKPQCDEQGRYKPMQCWHATGYCWCVDETGTAIEGTTMRGRPDCQRAQVPRRMMVSPRMMQKTISIDDQ